MSAATTKKTAAQNTTYKIKQVKSEESGTAG